MTDQINQIVTNSYDASNIQVLEGLDPVRTRPGMYIGSTDYRGLHHLMWEIVDNSVDEALAGHANSIEVFIDKNNIVTVTDNGRGIPTDMHPTKHRPALEIVMTVLHAGGKFGGGGYKVSGGLHGVGASVVNALSTWLQVEVRRDGKAYWQKYQRGVPTGDMQTRDLTPEEIEQHPRGTLTSWLADDTVFDTLAYSFETVSQRFRETCFLTKGLRIKLVDDRTDRELTFYFEGGVMSFVRHMNKNRGVVQQKPFYVQRGADGVDVEVAFQYTDSYNDSIHAFANNINTPDGGTHLTGFRTAMTRTINNYARKNNFLKEKDENLSGDDIRQGLTAIISVKLTDPQFEGQTKAKLGNANVKGAVESAVGDSLTTWLEENPADARKIVDKCMTAQRIREAQSKLKDTILRKSAFDGMTLPGKLADCSERDPGRSEIFIVEGDSAGGCFVGETRVALASGLTKTMAELASDWEQGIHHFGYATNKVGDVRIVPLIEPRLTKHEAALVEVVLDNGAHIRCTPDHLFRLRDGSYCEANKLEPGQSLMPLKTRLTGKEELPAPGYEMVWMNGQTEWHHTHHMADLYNMLTGVYTRKAGNTRHHKDFNKLNNDPRNIQRMFWRDHQQLHAELAGEMSKRLWQDPAYRERKIKQLSEQAIQQWQDPAYREYMRERVKIQRQDAVLNERLLQGFQDWFNALTIEEYSAYGERMRQFQEAYWSSPEHRQEQAQRTQRYFEEHPEAREQRREEAIKQWEDNELRKWRSEKTREQWQDEAYQRQHSAVVTEWWQQHPEHREKVAEACKRRWEDEQQRELIVAGLNKWRSSTSTEEKARLIREGYKLKSLLLLNKVLEAENVKQAYEQQRLETARQMMRYDRLVQEFFSGDEAKLHEAAANVNCKVVAVHELAEQADVYDLTVEGYHNFALADGVFVHNSAKQGRDRRFQAILPLRGKILNVERASLDKMLNSTEIKALITALGAGLGDSFDTGKLRYHRAIIMTDADVDGSHIRTLLLTFFFRNMKPLVADGYLYIAQPPLFRVGYGKEKVYAYSEAERDAVIKRINKENISIQRYKGLGEMNPEQLWETTMDPRNRTLLQVTIEDAAMADETFQMLMGDAVPPRKQFITTHAKSVKNLDI